MINQRVKFDHSSYRKLCEQIKKFAEQRLARGATRSADSGYRTIVEEQTALNQQCISGPTLS